MLAARLHCRARYARPPAKSTSRRAFAASARQRYAGAHMPALRVLYDISSLGVGHFAIHGRAGSHRVDGQLAGLLAASPECELLFCANESSLAWQGCVDYLRHHPALADVPLIAPPSSPFSRGLRSVVVSAHRR